MKILTQGLVAAGILAVAAGGWYAFMGGDPPQRQTAGPGARPGGGERPAGAPSTGGGAPGNGQRGQFAQGDSGGRPPGAGGAAGSSAPPGGGQGRPGGGPPGEASQGGPPRGPGGAAGGRRPQVVIVAPVETGAVTDSIESVGTAMANEAIVVTAKQTGTVAKILIEEGQPVAKGAILVELDARERRADLETAVAMRDEVVQRLDRARRMQAGSISQARIDELESQARAAEARVSSAKARREDNQITAPFAGRVGLRQVSLGALVQPGTPITTLDDVSIVKVAFSIPETVLDRLRPGLVISAKAPAYKDRVFNGTVTVVDTRIDTVTRAVRVHSAFDNKEGLLLPGMFLNVVLSLSTRPDAILVPEEALVASGTGHYVFKVVDGRAVRSRITIGVRLPGKVEVVKGLDAGEQVVIRGVQKVRDGQPVNAREPGSPGGPPGGRPGGRPGGPPGGPPAADGEGRGGVRGPSTAQSG